MESIVVVLSAHFVVQLRRLAPATPRSSSSSLAPLTHQSPDSFITHEGDEDLDIRDTRCGATSAKPSAAGWRPPITEFTTVAVEECPGTNDYRDTHLF